MFGGSVLGPTSLRNGWKPRWQFTLSTHNAEQFLLQIRPFVILKRPQVELALSFCEFQRMPKDERFDKYTIPSRNWRSGSPAHIPQWRRKPEVVQRELDFKEQMNALNKKGA